MDSVAQVLEIVAVILLLGAVGEFTERVRWVSLNRCSHRRRGLTQD